MSSIWLKVTSWCGAGYWPGVAITQVCFNCRRHGILYPKNSPCSLFLFSLNSRSFSLNWFAPRECTYNLVHPLCTFRVYDGDELNHALLAAPDGKLHVDEIEEGHQVVRKAEVKEIFGLYDLGCSQPWPRNESPNVIDARWAITWPMIKKKET